LAAAFRAGQVSLLASPPAGLTALSDPYDPAANRLYRSPPYWLHDLSLYRGKLYLYFGPVPALVLFAPWSVVTGSALPQRVGAAVFAGAGFLAAAGLLGSIRRRCFGTLTAAQSAFVCAALGLCAGVPLLLQRAETWETCIACGHALLMIALAAIWQALARPAAAVRWTALASIALAAALGARPSLAFCAAALLPLLWKHRRTGTVWAAAVVPLVAAVALLMIYNQRRFHDPLDFGQRFQLADDRQVASGNFSVRYVWFNLRVYFLQPVRLSSHFPYVLGSATIAPPAGHAPSDDAFGIFTCVPLALLAFAAPLAWRKAERVVPDGAALRTFGLCLLLAFGGAAGVLALFYGDCARYELEFLPALLILAVLGAWGIDRALRARRSARWWARAVMGLLLFYSIGFNLSAAAARHQQERADLARQRDNHAALLLEEGNVQARAGRLTEAAQRFREAIALKPDYAAAYCNLGSTYGQSGNLPAAEAQFRAALKCDPNYAQAEFNLAAALLGENRAAEAAPHFARARQLNPDLPPLPGLP
jgi:tetratricopeptide (TPR) repeat protein